jgi:hypothetical protein
LTLGLVRFPQPTGSKNRTSGGRMSRFHRVEARSLPASS